MKVAVIIARLLFGGLFLWSGLNHFFEFTDPPKPAPETADFWAGLVGSDYFMPLLKWTELICGAAIAVGVFVPLALIVIAPVVVNILAYHLFLDTSGTAVAVAVVVLQLFLFYVYRKHFLGVLNPFAYPSVLKRMDG